MPNDFEKSMEEVWRKLFPEETKSFQFRYNQAVANCFPLASEFSIIKPEWVDAAMNHGRILKEIRELRFDTLTSSDALRKIRDSLERDPEEVSRLRSGSFYSQTGRFPCWIFPVSHPKPTPEEIEEERNRAEVTSFIPGTKIKVIDRRRF